MSADSFCLSVGQIFLCNVPCYLPLRACSSGSSGIESTLKKCNTCVLSSIIVNYKPRSKDYIVIQEELIDESQFMRLPLQRQTELLSHYCGDIKDKIISSSTMTEAQRIADEQCLLFQRSCSSEVLRHAMTRYVQDIIKTKHHSMKF